MFTEEQINKIKGENFPEIYLKSVSINDKGDQNGIYVDFFVEEQLDNLKIFQNNNKDKIKIKIFLLRDNIPLIDLNSVSSIITLNNLLTFNSAEYQDIYASVDYLDRGNLLQNYLNNSLDSNFKLNYKSYFELSKNINIDNLSVGFMMYYDEKEYAKELNIDVNLLETSFLSGNVFLYALKQQGKNISNGKLKDFLAMKRIIQTSERLQEILQSIQIGTKIKSFSSQKIHPNKKIEYFSPLYPSIQENGNLNFVFFVDFKEIIKQNSFLKKLKINNESLKLLEQISLSTSEITSLTVFRKQYNNDFLEPSLKQKQKNIKTKVAKKNDNEIIVSSKDDNNNAVLITKINKDKEDNILSSIKEINGLFNGLRAFEVVDTTAYSIKNTTFEYGLKISISDYFYSYINSLIEILYENENIFKKYINDTYVFGNYNYTTDCFNDDYINYTFPSSLSSDIRKALAYFLSVLKIFGVIEKEEEILENLYSLLSPQTTTQQNLMYFLNFYSGVIQIIKNDLKSDNNKNIEINTWLKSDEIIDSINSPQYGYGYLYRKQDNQIGFLNTKSSILEKKISSDITAYMNTTNTNFDTDMNYCVSPSYISVGAKKQYLSLFEENTNSYKDLRSTISEEAFIDLDVNIKSYICSNKISTKEVIKNKEYINNINSRLSKILDINNVTIENFYNRFNEVTKPEALSINANIGSEQLLLALSKVELPTKQLIDNSSKIPFHIKSFMDRSNSFFELKSNESTYDSLSILNDLNKNSKFLFLFNTICKIQFLYLENTAGNSKSYSWRYLTSGNITSTSQKNILCKLSIYQNALDNFNNFYEIEMPIYDKYFIVEIENERISFPKNTKKTKPNLGKYTKAEAISQIRAESTFVTLSETNNLLLESVFNKTQV